eukprot:354448-Chlamydomonas_euryale.AAC.5
MAKDKHASMPQRSLRPRRIPDAAALVAAAAAAVAAAAAAAAAAAVNAVAGACGRGRHLPGMSQPTGVTASRPRQLPGSCSTATSRWLRNTNSTRARRQACVPSPHARRTATSTPAGGAATPPLPPRPAAARGVASTCALVSTTPLLLTTTPLAHEPAVRTSTTERAACASMSMLASPRRPSEPHTGCTARACRSSWPAAGDAHARSATAVAVSAAGAPSRPQRAASSACVCSGAATSAAAVSAPGGAARVGCLRVPARGAPPCCRCSCCACCVSTAARCCRVAACARCVRIPCTTCGQATATLTCTPSQRRDSGRTSKPSGGGGSCWWWRRSQHQRPLHPRERGRVHRKQGRPAAAAAATVPAALTAVPAIGWVRLALRQQRHDAAPRGDARKVAGREATKRCAHQAQRHAGLQRAAAAAPPAAATAAAATASPLAAARAAHGGVRVQRHARRQRHLKQRKRGVCFWRRARTRGLLLRKQRGCLLVLTVRKCTAAGRQCICSPAACLAAVLPAATVVAAGTMTGSAGRATAIMRRPRRRPKCPVQLPCSIRVSAARRLHVAQHHAQRGAGRVAAEAAEQPGWQRVHAHLVRRRCCAVGRHGRVPFLLLQHHMQPRSGNEHTWL